MAPTQDSCLPMLLLFDFDEQNPYNFEINSKDSTANVFLSSKTLSSSDHPADWILNTPINLSGDASTVSINTISDRNFDLFIFSC